MIKINSEVLKHFDKEGLSINEGIAIDARLIQETFAQLLNFCENSLLFQIYRHQR
jgi:hypothetical protein